MQIEYSYGSVGSIADTILWKTESDMARPLRITFEGAFYHVKSRGDERKAVFKSKRDREKFFVDKHESLSFIGLRWIE